MSRQIIRHHRAKIVTNVLAHLVAAAIAPLIIPFTSGWLFFLLHEWFYPSVWGLPPLQSLIGVSINSTAVGYFFTWFYGLPLAVILQWVNRYQISYLLIASSLPAPTLPFWQTEWTISVLPVWIAGASTAYVFWLLTRRKARQGPPSDTLTSRAHG